MTSRLSQAAFFFFAAVVFFLLAFFEKRLTLIKAQHKAQLEQVQKRLEDIKTIEPWDQSFQSLQEKQQKLEQTVQLLTLNYSPDRQSSDELAQEIIRQGLQLRSDLVFLWRSVVAQAIKNNEHERALNILVELKALPVEIRKQWLELLAQWPRWDGVEESFKFYTDQNRQRMQKEQLAGPWDYLGIEVQKQTPKNTVLDPWLPPLQLVQKRHYQQVCSLYLDDLNPDRWPESQALSKLCEPESYLKIGFIEDKN